MNLHRGQGMEIYFRDSNICPTEADYMDIVSNSKFYILYIYINT